MCNREEYKGHSTTAMEHDAEKNKRFETQDNSLIEIEMQQLGQ